MKKNIAFAFVFTVAAGCAAEAPDGGPNDPTNPDDPSDPTNRLDASGSYQMRSRFDLATNAPGKVGDAVRTIIDITDSPDDPSLWVLERVIEKMPSGSAKNFANSAKPYVAGYLNDRLLDFAPDLVSKFIAIGNDFGQIAKNFGLNEMLEVAQTSDGYVAVHTALGTHFTIDGVESDHNFADFQVANIVTSGVGVMLDQSGKLTIADHKLGLTMGKVLRVGLDGAIIPAIEPTAKNLGDVFVQNVDCVRVGIHIRDALERAFGYGGSASQWQGACVSGLGAAAQFVYARIDAIDSSALEFSLVGEARGIDKNGDKKIDSIQTGAWTGNLSYAGTPAPLAGATFYGERM